MLMLIPLTLVPHPLPNYRNSSGGSAFTPSSLRTPPRAVSHPSALPHLSRSAAGPEARIVRVMPNTPCLVGAAAAAMCLGGGSGPEDEAAVHALLSSVGKVFTVTEPQLSAVTGVSGSGPAYMFMIIEALADGGVKAGLPRDIALALAAQVWEDGVCEQKGRG
eukprot:362589-Chlamydomonas_euryale.AAC.9